MTSHTTVSRRTALGITAAAALKFSTNLFAFGETPKQNSGAQAPNPSTREMIHLSTGTLTVSFERSGLQLKLLQIAPYRREPILYGDSASNQAGAAGSGNPLSVHLLGGPKQGVYGMKAFSLTQLKTTSSNLLAYISHHDVPLQMALEVIVEGDVIRWRGQAVWNGDSDQNIDIYFPLLADVRFDKEGQDRLIAGELSGTEYGPLSAINFSVTYLGGMSIPAYLVEGGGHGLAFLEDNRADFAADSGGCSQRSAVVGTVFPLLDDGDAARVLASGKDGPFAGWRYRRLLLGTSRFGGRAEYDEAESHGTLPLIKLGDSFDLGPSFTCHYDGPWKAGALWLREKRQALPMRVSPAKWYQDTTFLGEEYPDRLVRVGGTLYDLPLLLGEKHSLGSDMDSVPGFNEPEILGTDENMLNRGDYFYPAENIGGLEAMQRGVEAAHRQGSRVLLYVEGLIVWKRSRIGRSKAPLWALKNADGSFTENYRGFYDMCPAEPGWQDWFARTLAEIVRNFGVDGFFMDSMLATDNHRCFNPAHAHSPQPDVWNWGLRRVLSRVREEVDKVAPDTILLCEGVGDIAREFIDGTLSHGHAWSRMHFTVPLLRFVYPSMRAFEAWGQQPRAQDAPVWPTAKPVLWSAVQGYRIFAEQENREVLAPTGRLIREYYDLYPEICDAPMSSFDVRCNEASVQLFDSLPRVLTIGNLTGSAVTAHLDFPLEAQTGLLFNRRDQSRIAVMGGKAEISLIPWDYRAFELRA